MAHFPANSNGIVELTTNRVTFPFLFLFFFFKLTKYIMESFLTNCHTTTKKQQNMHDVISNKLESFYNLLQTTKESLSDGGQEK